MNPTISIIVPVYNVEKYLGECLDSILQQTYPHLQIICVDDGSADSSGKILDEYAQNDSRIVVIHQKNGGVGKAFNTGYKKAIGTYIGYVEPDDFIEKDMYAKLLQVIEKDGSDIARGNFVAFDSVSKWGIPASNTVTTRYASQSPINPLESPEIFLYNPAIWSNLYRKSLLDDNNIRFMETPGASFQDGPFFFKVCSCAKTISLIDTDLYHYRLHSGQSIRKAKLWFYEKGQEELTTYISEIKDKKIATLLSVILLRSSLHTYEYSLQILDKDEVPKMCQFILTEIRKIPDSWVNKICISRHEKLLYLIFKYNFTYAFYLFLIPINMFMKGSIKNRNIIRFLLGILN